MANLNCFPLQFTTAARRVRRSATPGVTLLPCLLCRSHLLDEEFFRALPVGPRTTGQRSMLIALHLSSDRGPGRPVSRLAELAGLPRQRISESSLILEHAPELVERLLAAEMTHTAAREIAEQRRRGPEARQAVPTGGTPTPSGTTLKALNAVDDLRGRLEGESSLYITRVQKGHLHEAEALHLAGAWITGYLATVQRAADAVAAAITPW